MAFILTVLKIIAIIIAVVIALAVIIIGAVLVMPFKYEVFGEKYEKIKALASVKWLFGIVNVSVSYEGEEPDISVKIFGKTVYPKEEKEDKPVEIKERGKGEKNEKIEIKEEPVKKAETIKTEPNKAAEPPKRKVEEKPKPKAEPMEKKDVKPKVTRVKMSDEMPEEETPPPKKMTKKEFVIDYLKNMTMEERKGAVLAVLNLLKDSIKHILPKFIRVYAILGIGDPATTGYILAAAGAARGITGQDITIVGDFENSRVEGEGEVKGQIRLGRLLYLGIRLVLTKPIRQFIVRFIKIRGELV